MPSTKTDKTEPYAKRSQKKVVILDRDGVINHDSDDYIKSPDEWQAIDGAPEAIGKLNQAGYTCVVATNQSGIGRGLYTLEAFFQISQKMTQTLTEAKAYVDFVLYCPHTPEDDCGCRKPKTDMLEEALKRLRVEADSVYMVGDSLRDIQAAIKMQMKPILVKTGQGEQTASTAHADLSTVPVFDSLLDFVDNLLQKKAS